MSKIKQLTWFGVFVSLGQYVRERHFITYIIANIFNLFLFSLLLLLYYNGYLSFVSFTGIFILLRLISAPVDDIASDVTAYSQLQIYPLNIFEKIYLRLITKITQFSEWVTFIALFLICRNLYTLGEAIAIISILIMALELGEEVIFFSVYLVKKRKLISGLYYLFCLGNMVIVYSLCKDAVVDAGTLIDISLIWVLLSVIALTLIHLLGSRIRALPACPTKKSVLKQSLTTKLLLTLKPDSIFSRLYLLELIMIFKHKFWNIISVIGYLVMFMLLEPTIESMHVLSIYFIADLAFLNGFNIFGLVEDQYVAVLFATVPHGTLLRSKNAAHGTALLLLSMAITPLLGLYLGSSIKAIIHTLMINTFVISLVMFLGCLISIAHFHLSNSKKKYTIKNILIMLGITIICSVISSFSFAQGTIGGIASVFMVLTACMCLYFSLIETENLEKYFSKSRCKMIKNL